MSSTRMRPLEARLAALRGAKSGCGCGHAHGPAGHGIHGNHGTVVSPGSADSATSSGQKKEAA